MWGSILFIALILPQLGNSQSTINEQQWRQIQQELNEGLYRVQQDLKEEITKVIDNEINVDCGKHLLVAMIFAWLFFCTVLNGGAFGKQSGAESLIFSGILSKFAMLLSLEKFYFIFTVPKQGYCTM